MFSIDGINSAVLAERAREVLSMMQRRGIHVPSDNRLRRAAAFTDSINNRFDAGRSLPAESDLLKRVTEAWRTMWEAFVVMHAATQGRASSTVLDNNLLASFLSGADIPTEDLNPLPRSTQFEAFTAAALVHSGLSVTRDEPDFRFQFYDETVGVAVKRLTSLRASKVYDEIRDASNQIRGQGLRGFIALSLDNWIADLGDDMKDASAVGTRFNAQLMDAHRQLMKLSERPVLLGAFISINWSQWVAVEGRPYLQWSAPDQTVCFTENEEQVMRSRDFFEPARIRWHQSLAEAAALVS